MCDSALRFVGLGVLLFLMGGAADAQPNPAAGPGAAPGASVLVPGDVALGALMRLSDGYLQKFADSFSLLARTAEVRSGDWYQIREPLTALAQRNVEALVWFALPDGRYWSVQQGQSSGNLSDRPYFPHVLAGETVIGSLVFSKATGKASAIVAVPIWDNGVIGVLGASVYLDQLSARLDREMRMSADMIFFSFDATPLLALEWDPKLILVDPYAIEPEIRAAFEYALARTAGTVRYRLADGWRTVIFQRSPITGWWYGVGVIGGRTAAAAPR